ncbi:hypothetical protein [Candidatus Electronema sp. TJ]|uniref:hypothetical protein n=1 Tax=Candidatus Electronema sp. TJ TaxID=3401573 RepID=UPI003AA8A51B
MRRPVLLHCLAALVFLLAAVAHHAAAQMLMPQYNWSTYMRFMARVESINTLQNPKSGMFGLHLFARDSLSNIYLVHISPQWYADKHPEQFNFRVGDLLIISGSRFATGLTKNNILAASIVNCSRNYAELRIRDPYTGQGLWHNQPDNLVERIQTIQKRLFSVRSEAVRRSMEPSFPKGSASVPMLPFVPALRFSAPSQPSVQPPSLSAVSDFFWF